jgi:hypothetical protein
MEDDMAQIDLQHVLARLVKAVDRLSAKVRDGLKWWAEHQAWPAIDDVRIADRDPSDKEHAGQRPLLRF